MKLTPLEQEMLDVLRSKMLDVLKSIAKRKDGECPACSEVVMHHPECELMRLIAKAEPTKTSRLSVTREEFHRAVSKSFGLDAAPYQTIGEMLHELGIEVPAAPEPKKEARPRRWVVEFPDIPTQELSGTMERSGFFNESGRCRVSNIREVKPITREALGANTAVLMGWRFTKANAATFLRDLGIEVED